MVSMPRVVMAVIRYTDLEDMGRAPRALPLPDSGAVVRAVVPEVTMAPTALTVLSLSGRCRERAIVWGILMEQALIGLLASSPAAAEKALTTRLEGTQEDLEALANEERVFDGTADALSVVDLEPAAQIEDAERLTALIEEARNLAGLADDPKLAARVKELKGAWEIKSPEHQEARTFIYETWPKQAKAAEMKATLEEARANLEEAAELILDANRTLLEEELKGAEVIREPFTVTR